MILCRGPGNPGGAHRDNKSYSVVDDVVDDDVEVDVAWWMLHGGCCMVVLLLDGKME